MINKFKNWLGIEGVKAKLKIQEPLKRESGVLDASLELHTIRDQKVESIHIKLIEKYKRGKKESLKIDEFSLGELVIPQQLELAGGTSHTIDFKLNFKILESSMDRLGNKNFITKGLVSLLKKEQQVSSTYRLEITIHGTGAAAAPVFKFPVEFNKKRQA